MHDALSPQDGLYTLAELDATTTFRVIGAVKTVLTVEKPDRDPARAISDLTPHIFYLSN